MAYDPGIFAQANRPTVALRDPNEMLGQAADSANKLFAIRQNAARQAVGEAYQQATGADGQLDVNKLRGLIAADPRAAMGAQEANTNAQSLGVSKQDMALRQNQFVGQALGAVLDLPDGELHDGVVDAVTRARAAGLVDERGALKLMGQFPDDPGKLRTRLRQVQLGLQAPGAQQEAMAGAATTRDDGQSIQSGVQLPASKGGGFVPSTTTPVYPSRSQLAGQQAGVDSEGKPTQETTADRLARQGRPELAGPAGTPPGRVPAGLLPPGYNGRYGGPRAAAPAAAPGAPLPAGPAPASAQPAETGQVATGLAPGTADEMQASAAHAVAARNEANSYQSRMTPLLSAQEALKTAKTGVGTETLNSLRQRLQNFTPGMLDGFRPLGGSPEGDAAFDEARKYLTAYASSTPGANRSDASGATADAANASVHISPAAAKFVVRAAIGMERMKQAQTLEFNSSGKPGSAYDRHQNDLATKADPRAFVADQMTPDERRALLDKMTAPQKKNYLDSLRMGLKHGLLTLPGAQ